jgi:hypothetical protein
MYYIAPRAMPIETDSTPLPLIWRGNTVARESAPSSLDELMDKVSIRLVSPAVLQVVAADSQESLCLVRLGFRLKLPDDMGIRWLRFSTKISHTGGEGNPTRPVGIVVILSRESA